MLEVAVVSRVSVVDGGSSKRGAHEQIQNPNRSPETLARGTFGGRVQGRD